MGRQMPWCLPYHKQGTLCHSACFCQHLGTHTAVGEMGVSPKAMGHRALLSTFPGAACVCVCVWYWAPRPCNRDDGSPLKKNDSQNKKTTPICHLKQSLIVRQQQPRAGIDYKQDDTSLRAASCVFINKYRSLRHLHDCRGQMTPRRAPEVYSKYPRGYSGPFLPTIGVLPHATPFYK